MTETKMAGISTYVQSDLSGDFVLLEAKCPYCKKENYITAQTLGDGDICEHYRQVSMVFAEAVGTSPHEEAIAQIDRLLSATMAMLKVFVNADDDLHAKLCEGYPSRFGSFEETCFDVWQWLLAQKNRQGGEAR